MDFLKELRLGRAARLLETTDLPVKTIAARVGFSSRSHFSRAFKAAMHLEPTAYRASTHANRANPESMVGA
jgi:transcriptional regulator GlxA family with amidase domain